MKFLYHHGHYDSGTKKLRRTGFVKGQKECRMRKEEHFRPTFNNNSVVQQVDNTLAEVLYIPPKVVKQ